jgi:tripartite-type tricarboxylate transporter receptor subunit TctC
MKLLRRYFLTLAAAATAVPVLLPDGKAQAYPSSPVRVIVGFPAGGGVDFVTRVIAQWLSEHLGVAFVVENRGGAAGNIATEMVVRSPADGYTLLIAVPGNAINATFYTHLDFNFLKDIAPVASLVRSPLIMVVNPAFPAKSLPEFIAYAKTHPGKLNYASPGTGSSLHLATELFKMMAGIEMTHVPYNGVAPALTDLLSGQVQIMLADLSSLEYIKAGKLRALAVTEAKRAAFLPDVPTIAEFVPGYEATTWYGIGAPRQTPTKIVDLLNREINASLADRTVQSRLETVGYTPFPNSPAQFGKFIAAETEKWAKVIRMANIKPPQ